jgi:glyoxylase-like metal-dependent hydrolase (beta-lactamase superfamily II)
VLVVITFPLLPSPLPLPWKKGNVADTGRMTAMGPTTHRFTVGGFECYAASDGQYAYAAPLFPPPAPLLFANAEPNALGNLLREAGLDSAAWTEWTSSYTCLAVRTDGHLVLVDTGAGGLSSGTGRLLESLAQEGIQPEDVGTVILTHVHPDHAGGILDADGVPVFSRARWVMARAEWEFWMEGTAERLLPEHGRLLVDMARRQLSPLEGIVELTIGEEELLPGVRVLPTPGHTAGHLSVVVGSGDEELLCLGDLFLHPIHVRRPEWHGIVDALPEQLAESRKHVLERAAADRPLLLAFHFPFPGLGRISRGDDGWRWEPPTM